MMGIWMPYANISANLLVLSDSHLADVVFQGLDTLRSLPSYDGPSDVRMGRSDRMWYERPGALLFYVISAEAEYRRRGLGEEPRVVKAFTWYGRLDIPLPARPPWWFGSPMFHRSQRSHLIRVDPEWYARRLPLDTPLDMALLWPLAEPHEWEMTGAGLYRNRMVGRGRNSDPHKEHVRNNFRRKNRPGGVVPD
jgi:hypothetical protein